MGGTILTSPGKHIFVWSDMQIKYVPATWLLLLAALPAWASIGFDAGSSTTAANVSSISWQHTVSGANRILFVASLVTPPNGVLLSNMSTTVVTYAGLPMRLALAGQFPGFQSLFGPPPSTVSENIYNSVQIWYLVNPPLGTAAVSITYPQAFPVVLGLASSFTGVSQTVPIAVTGAVLPFSDSASVTISTATANSWMVSVGATGSVYRAGPASPLVERAYATSQGNSAILATLATTTPGQNTGQFLCSCLEHSEYAIELVDANSTPAPSGTIALDATSSMPGSGNSLSWTHTTSGTNRLLTVASVANSNSNSPAADMPVTGITYGGQALSQAAAVSDSSGATRTELWYLVNPPSGSNTIQINYTGSVVEMVGSAASFTGVAQVSPVGASGSSSSGPSVTLTSSGGSMIVAAGDGTITANGPMSEPVGIAGSYGTVGSLGTIATGPAGSYTASWASVSYLAQAAVAVEFLPLPPAISAVSPANNSTQTVWGLTTGQLGGSLVVMGTVSSPQPGMGTVACNGVAATLVPTSGTSPIMFSCLPPVTALGAQTITIVATDIAGNSSTFVDNVTIVVDAQPPAISGVAPASGTTLTPASLSTGMLGGTLAITGTAAEPSSGVPLPQSGIQSVTCNGVTATLSAGVGSQSTPFSCAVSIGTAGAVAVTIVATDRAGNSVSSSVNYTMFGVTSISPTTAHQGDLVTVTGGFPAGVVQISLSQQGGGTILAPVANQTATTLTVTVPAGAATGVVMAATGGLFATGPTLSVAPASTFHLSVAPSAISTFPGAGTAGTGLLPPGYNIQISSTNGFSQLVTLSISGLPTGVTGTFSPPQLGVGSFSVLTLAIPAGQALSTSLLTLTAQATVQGITLSQSAALTLTIQAATTSFVGRVVSADAYETPLGGVTVMMLGQDGSGNATGCTGQTTTDGAGNDVLTNLPASCVGKQLIRYNGSAVTSPAGQTYSNVDLIYTLTLNQVAGAPTLTHLPRLDNAEAFQVRQNWPTDQVFTFQTVPNSTLTVYAGTTLTNPLDGSTPDPFTFTIVHVPSDRTPDFKAPSPVIMNAYLISYQPSGTYASQPAAVSYPNVLNVPIGTTNITLMTLDPAQGQMVVYGTGHVSNDGNQILPDPDPNHPGHAYGLVRFDWHGAMPAPAGVTPCSLCVRVPKSGHEVDFSSGVEQAGGVDIGFGGQRGGIYIQRMFQTRWTDAEIFGIGSSHNYNYRLDTFGPNIASVITLTIPDGNRFPFVRQGDGTLINTTNPRWLGVVMTTYPDQTAQLRWKDGTVFLFTNQAAKLVSITDPNGNKTTLTYGTLGTQLLSITDPVGRVLNLAYDGSNRVTQITDPQGNRTVHYSYNAAGYMDTVTDALGQQKHYTYDSTGLLLTFTNERGQMWMNTSTNGAVTQEQAPDGGITKVAYTLLDPLVQYAGVEGGGGGGAIDGFGQAIVSPVIAAAVTDPLGHTTTYRFDTKGYPSGVIDALGQARTFTRDPNTGLVLQETGNALCDICGDTAAGNVTYTYDARGNVLTVTDSLQNTVTFTYDPVFNRVTSIKDPIQTLDSSKGQTTFQYDGYGNLTLSTDALLNQTQYAYDANGLLTQTTDATGESTRMTYDAQGNLSTVTDALGSTTRYFYDAVSRLTSVVDALGRKSTIMYDNLDRVTSQTDGQGQTVSFQYDQVGNLLTLTDAKSNTTTFTYDPNDRLQTRTTPSPANRVDTRTYDLNGNLKTFQDRRGMTSTFNYDPLDRLTTETYTDNTVTRTYDANSRLVKAADNSGSSLFSYDAAGRLLQTINPVGSVDYARDPLGRVTSRTVASQPSVTYQYGVAGNLTSAGMTGGPSVGFNYDVRNLLKSQTRSNGVNSTYNYDPLGRVLSIANGALDSHMYTYDAAGQRVSKASNPSQALQTAAVSSATYDNENHLTAFGGTLYTYDLNGNRATETTSSGTTTYTWDGENRLKQIALPGSQGTYTFTYDFAGNLIQQGQPGVTTKSFVLDDLTNVVYQQDTAGNSFSTVSAQAIDSQLALVFPNGTAEFGLTDALGSASTISDQSGALAGNFYYEPYGQTTAAVASQYPFLFTGRPPTEGNIYYYRARYYDTSVGRFISEDPIGFYGGDNLYRYIENGPTESVDPFGLQSYATLYAGYGAVGVAGTVAVGSVVVDVATGGINILATPAEIGAGALVGGLIGYGVGTVVDLGTAFFSKGGEQNILPSWVDKTPRPGQSGKEFAKEVCDRFHGIGNYNTGPGSEYNKIKKWLDKKLGKK
jgi:RHS repeat-associated protein